MSLREHVDHVKVAENSVLVEPLDQVRRQEVSESEPGSKGVGIVEGSGKMGDQEEGQEGIEPGALVGMSLQGQVKTDLS